MIRPLLVLLSFISVIFLPWLVTIVLVLVVATLEPLLPFAIGIFADTLYYHTASSSYPRYALLGIGVTVAVLFVRSQLRTSIIRR